MPFSTLVDRIALSDPEHSHVDATVMLEAVVLSMTEMLPRALALELVMLIPGKVEIDSDGLLDPDVARFYARIAEHTGSTVSRAMERAQIALSKLGTELDPELYRRLMRELPAEISGQLHVRAALPAPLHMPRSHQHEDTLARGRPR